MLNNSSIRVLLVDDERDLVDTLIERLELRGFDVQPAYGGKEALERIESEGFDHVVLDLRMPDIDGIEVLQKTMERCPNTNVVILTGHGSEDDRRKCFELGAAGFMSKPVKIDALAQMLRKIAEEQKL